MSERRIGVVVDWKRRSRLNAWVKLFGELNNSGRLPNHLREYRLADTIVKEPGPGTSEDTHANILKSLDVLIINWDALNGDPDFGSHLALNWIASHRPEILQWVRGGKVLIIETQAFLQVPSQEAYDAVVGPGELPVCGQENTQNVLEQTKRVGYTCRKTKRAPKTDDFDSISDLSKRGDDNKFENLFPERAGQIVTPFLDTPNFERRLYRGWFRRTLRARKQPWVTIFETADRRGLWANQSTMQVAKVGEGAIFATTMFLASTYQDKLVLAMLKCNVDKLPMPTSLVESFKKIWKEAVGPLVIAVATFLVFQRLNLPAFRSGSQEPLKDLIKSVVEVLIALSMGLLFFIGGRFVRFGKSAVRKFMGY